MSEATRAEAQGQVLRERYALGRVLRSAASAVAHEALDRELHAPVTVVLTTSPAARAFFAERQASLVGRRWRSFSTIRELAWGQGECDYLVSESPPGELLEPMLTRSGPFDVADAVRLVLDLGADLEEAFDFPQLCRAIQPSDACVWRGPGGVWQLRFGWLGLIAALERDSPDDQQSQPQLLLELLVQLVGQVGIVSSTPLADIVERAMHEDARFHFADRAELMAALLPLTRSESGLVPKLRA
jgi:hypothetical protein